MKYCRIVLLAIFALSLSPVKAQDDSASKGFTLLNKVSQSIKELGDYRVAFSVSIGGESVDGSYVVSGDEYYMELATAEIYCDEGVRYEVNNRDLEIVVDNVDLNSHNLLNNPTRGFNFLETQFTAKILSESVSEVTVRLDPKSEDALSLGYIVVRMDIKSGLPTSIIYDMDGDSVRIIIESFTASSSPKKFERGEYKKYEWIDFR